MKNYIIQSLSCQRELHREAEIVGGGGVSRRGEQRGIGLLIIVGRQRQEAREGVVGHKRNLESSITT